MKEPLVADILDSYRVVLNAGENDGLSVGDKFLIYGLSKEIKDPITKEPIEKLEVVRGTGKVIHLQKKICTVESIETNVVTSKKPSSNFWSTESESKTERVLKPFYSPQIGDYARPIKEPVTPF